MSFIDFFSKGGMRSFFRKHLGLIRKIRRDARRMVRNSKVLAKLEKEESDYLVQGDLTKLVKTVEKVQNHMIQQLKRALDIIWQVNRIRLKDIERLRNDIDNVNRLEKEKFQSSEQGSRFLGSHNSAYEKSNKVKILEAESKKLSESFGKAVTMLERLKNGENPTASPNFGADEGSLLQGIISDSRMARRHFRQMKRIERALKKSDEASENLSRAFTQEQYDLNNILVQACLEVYNLFFVRIKAKQKIIKAYQLHTVGDMINNKFESLKEDAIHTLENYAQEAKNLQGLAERSR